MRLQFYFKKDYSLCVFIWKFFWTGFFIEHHWVTGSVIGWAYVNPAVENLNRFIKSHGHLDAFGDHPFSAYAKFFRKTNFLPPDTHTYVFRKILRTYEMGDSVKKISSKAMEGHIHNQSDHIQIRAQCRSYSFKNH